MRTARPAASRHEWLNQGGWEAIEFQIRKPVERPAAGSVALPNGLQFPAMADPGSEPDSQSEPETTENVATEAVPGLDGVPADEIDSAESSDSPLTPEFSALRQRIHSVLAHYQTRKLNTRDHNPWEVMHGIVAYNTATEIRRDGPGGPQVNAVGWLLSGGRCRGQQMVTLIRGRPHAEEGVGVQGHPAQLLAILAQSRASVDTPMRIGGQEFILQDLIDEEMLDCRAGSELTFKLISFAHYLKSDATWRSRDGQAWSIPRLINAEIQSPIRGAACGGTHRLFGITYAYKMREKDGQPVDGEFLRARQYITSYQKYAWSLQNPDGSFSTEWFARRGDRPDIDRKIQTSGHILEWLVFSLSDEELREPRTLKSVNFLVNTLAAQPNRAWSIGPLGHALHALAIYDERVFGGDAAAPVDSVARDSTIDAMGDEQEEPLYDAAAEETADATATLAAPQGPSLPGLK
jgi:hypothetical protein